MKIEMRPILAHFPRELEVFERAMKRVFGPAYIQPAFPTMVWFTYAVKDGKYVRRND